MNKAAILIVEDEAIVAADLAAKLRQLGHEVVGTAGKGEEAVAMARRLRPQVVLMDIRLKGPMDGVEAAAAIRRQNNVPVIYLTAHSDAATLARAKLTEPFGYILKPFDERELATHIEMALYKHQAEQELRRQREWLRVTLTSIGDAVLATDAGGRITFLNPVAAELTGWSPEEATGRPIGEVFRIINEKTRRPADDIVARVLREGCVVGLANDTALVSRDGREVPIEDSAAPIQDDAGHVLGVVLVFHDVTENRQAREALRAAKDELEEQVEQRTAALRRTMGSLQAERQRFQDVLDNLPAYLVLLSRDYRVPFENRFFRERFGTSCGRRCFEYLFDRTEPCENCETYKVLETGGPHRWEWGGPDGRTYEIYDFPFTDADGSTLIMEVGLDITDRRQAEGKLEQYRQHLEELVQERSGQLEALMQALPVGVAICDAQGGLSLTNPAFERIWGGAAPDIDRIADYPRREGWCAETGQPVAADQWAALRAARHGETVTGQHLQIERLDGSRAFVHNNAAPIRHADGRVLGSAVAILDVTEAEAAVRRHNAVLQGINRILEAALAASTEDELGRTCLAMAEEVTGSRMGFLGEIGPDGLFHALAVSDLGWEACAMSDGAGKRRTPGSFPVHGIYGRVLQDGKGLFTNEPGAHPDRIGLPAGHPPLEAFLGVPLLRDGQTIGMIAVGNRPGGYRQEHMQALESLAGAIVQAIDRQRAEAALATAKASAEAANAAKSRLLANMSHELRTPMNAILGMIDVALPKAVDPVVRDCLETARGSADLLLTLLNDLLDTARIESGRLELESAPFSVREMLDHVTRVLSVRASEKGLSLYCRVPDEIPDAVLSDRMRLQQVLLNLAGNAIKFTERGEVEISVRGESRDDQARMEFAVRDTGMGIPPDRLESLFQPFAQADPSMARRFGGTGLGLSICKSLVELMGGRIGVESEVGRGSTFSFHVALPLAGQLPVGAGMPTAVAEAAPAALRILLVEDNPANQKLATYILQDRGHAVEIAEDGRAAVDLAGKNRYDVILMDVQMPGMDGLEATAAIRRGEGGGDRVPILAMTAHAMMSDRDRCLASGMDGYLAKPVNAREMIALVEGLARAPAPAAPVAPEPAATASPTTAIFDREEALARCFDNRDMVRKMIESFFRDTEELFPPMRAALAAGDLEEVGRLGHRIKGTVIYLAAQPAIDAAQRVEQLATAPGGAAQAVDALEQACTALKALLAEQDPSFI